jgi:hypothetical protein
MNDSSLHLIRAREHRDELRKRAAVRRRLRRAKAA